MTTLTRQSPLPNRPASAASAPSRAGTGSAGDVRARLLKLKSGSEAVRSWLPGWGRSSCLRNLAVLSRHLHALVLAGTPLVEALAAMEQQSTDTHWRQILADVRQKVEQGSPLSDAMAEHPDVFDAITCSLVAAGESSGRLAEMFDRLARLLRRQLQIRQALIGAMIYPVLLMSVGTLVLLALLLFVLPRFEGLFQALEAPLPPLTLVLLAIGRFLRTAWWGVGLALVAVLGVTIWWVRRPSGRIMIDRLVLRLPKIGGLVRNLTTARLARVLGVLTESQVPLLEALHLTRQSMSNVHYQRLLEKVSQEVAEGRTISSAIQDSDLISPAVRQALRHGEQSGQVGPLLLVMADFLDEENELVVRTLMSILEPVILIGLGLMVGLLAVSMFLPLFDLATTAQGVAG